MINGSNAAATTQHNTTQQCYHSNILNVAAGVIGAFRFVEGELYAL